MKKLLSVLLGLSIVSSIPVYAALYGDVNQDGLVDSTDAALTLQYAAYVGATGDTSDFTEYLCGIGIIEYGQQFTNSTDYVNRIIDKIGASNPGILLVSFVDGAIDGMTFYYNENKYELYHFKSGSAELEQAKSGIVEMKMTTGVLSGELTCKVSGDYILTYKAEDETVFSAFLGTASLG